MQFSKEEVIRITLSKAEADLLKQIITDEVVADDCGTPTEKLAHELSEGLDDNT